MNASGNSSADNLTEAGAAAATDKCGHHDKARAAPITDANSISQTGSLSTTDSSDAAAETASTTNSTQTATKTGEILHLVT